MIVFAMYGVKNDLKLTEEQREKFEAAMIGWWKRHKMWPDGF